MQCIALDKSLAKQLTRRFYEVKEFGDKMLIPIPEEDNSPVSKFYDKTVALNGFRMDIEDTLFWSLPRFNDVSVLINKYGKKIYDITLPNKDCYRADHRSAGPSNFGRISKFLR